MTPLRSLTLLGLAQVICFLLGFFALGLVLKLNGYPDGNPAVIWSPLAVFLRSNRLFLLVLPLLWTGYAVAAERLQRGWFSSRLALGIGVILCGGTVLIYLYAMIFRFSAVMTIR